MAIFIVQVKFWADNPNFTVGIEQKVCILIPITKLGLLIKTKLKWEAEFYRKCEGLEIVSLT